MAIPLTAQQRADLNDPSIPKDVVWCLSINTDEGLLAINNRSTPVTYQSVAYEAGVDKWKVDGELAMGSNLVPETIQISFDASEIHDDTSFAGRLVDRTWHRRRVKIFLLLYNAATGAFICETRQVFAFADTLDDVDQVGAPAQLTMGCETGTIRALASRRNLCSDADQRKRNPTDAFFRNVGVKGSQQVPFGVAWSNVPGRAGASGGFRGGFSNFGGGSFF